jgi:hypothetical protein
VLCLLGSIDQHIGLLHGPKLTESDGVVVLWRIRCRLCLHFFLLNLEPTAVCLLIDIALLKLLNQIEDSFDLMLIYLLKRLPHVAFHRLELGELEYQLGKT